MSPGRPLHQYGDQDSDNGRQKCGWFGNNCQYLGNSVHLVLVCVELFTLSETARNPGVISATQGGSRAKLPDFDQIIIDNVIYGKNDIRAQAPIDDTITRNEGGILMCIDYH